MFDSKGVRSSFTVLCRKTLVQTTPSLFLSAQTRPHRPRRPGRPEAGQGGRRECRSAPEDARHALSDQRGDEEGFLRSRNGMSLSFAFQTLLKTRT